MRVRSLRMTLTSVYCVVEITQLIMCTLWESCAVCMSDQETNDRKYLLIGDVIPNISGQTSRYRLPAWSIGIVWRAGTGISLECDRYTTNYGLFIQQLSAFLYFFHRVVTILSYSIGIASVDHWLIDVQGEEDKNMFRMIFSSLKIVGLRLVEGVVIMSPNETVYS